MRAVLLVGVILGCLGCQKQPGAVAAMPERQAAAAEPGSAAGPRGEQAARADEPAAAAEKRATTEVAKEPASTAEEIFDVLTAHSWTSHVPNQPAFPPMDYSVAAYRADGTWSNQFFTDYQIAPRTGRWNLQQNQGAWWICLDDGSRSKIELGEGGTIVLGPGKSKLYLHEPLKREPGQTAAKLPKLTLVPEVQEIARRLTAHKWKRANDMDLFMEPTLVEFRPDWTYTGIYRGGKCKSEGTWYATAKEIGAHSPTGRCDRPESGSGGDQFPAQVIDDRRILISWDLYVPEDEPLPRGIIWKLFGFSDVAAIRIEYDMPIRRGVPTTFDVTINNAGREALTLERFSFTKGYSDYGRGIGDRGKELVLPDDELASHDLAGALLQPGQSHAFRLSATFSEAGTPIVYFNALISGTSQNWDFHQAHWPSVGE
jgi:hypothetical protein